MKNSVWNAGRYGLAVASIVVALGLSRLIQPAFGYRAFLLFLAAVLVSGWFGGLGPALVATAAGAAAADYFLIDPVYKVDPLAAFSHVELASFLITAVVNAVLIGLLRKAMNDLAAARVALQAGLQDRMAAWASIAHDLKNPLGAIGLRAQLLRRNLTKDPRPELQAEGLSQIVAISRQTSQLLTELIDNARLDMGAGLTLEPEVTDLVGLTRQAIAEVGDRVTAPITLTTEAPTLVGRWDPLRTKRVLANLLSNALKYSPNGGEIAVAVFEEQEKGRRYACVRVEDHGLGIPAKDLKHVFERFYRAENVRGHIAGAGLGLAGSRQIVQAQGGTIGLHSAEGVGTRVTVRLPIVALPAEPPLASPEVREMAPVEGIAKEEVAPPKS